ncbi:MAG: tetratricopeptide repeat protein [Flavobacteriales bacterium]|nr:tetratricopeptide repeat protein [Flavobacteriales bacterium]
MRFSLILFLCSLSIFSSAQTSDEELAGQYFANREFDKAVILYKKLHRKDPESMYIYRNYLSCLKSLNEMDEAEKVIERAAKKNPSNQIYWIDLGQIYHAQGKDKEEQALYAERIDKLQPNPTEIEQLANSFARYELYDFAEQTILKGRRLLNAPVAFHSLLTGIYQKQLAHQKLIEECLVKLRYEPLDLESVKESLIPVLSTPGNVEYLQEKALTYAQKFPQNTSFDDLTMWVLIQQKKFKSALRQAIAIDKRQQGEGQVVFDLAQVCKNNKAYDVALSCFENLINRGEDNYFFLQAHTGVLESRFAIIRDNPNPNEAELDQLITAYKDFLVRFGRSWNTSGSMKELADIYIFYKHDLRSGMDILEELTGMPRLQPHKRAEYKLALADAYVINDEVWDATLLYGQVDKEFKEDVLGHEAKFRNARLSYFRGDFDWAKDQLDILKTATTQLIANNAIELALLIQDNIGLDSNTEALKAYAEAQLLLFQNKLDACLEKLNMLPFKYPNHSLEDEIYFTKAQVMEAKKDFKQAETYYLSVVDLFPEDILADNALYRLGLLYENKIQDPEKAKATYEKLIFNYTGSLFVVDARKRYKSLSGDNEPAPLFPN